MQFLLEDSIALPALQGSAKDDPKDSGFIGFGEDVRSGRSGRSMYDSGLSDGLHAVGESGKISV